MEWFIFSYWLPAEPSRKRVFVWRQLKKIGALSADGTGWLVPKTDALSSKITDIMHTVEEMGGTTRLYIANHFSETQEQDTIAKFQQERGKEYFEIIKECHKALKHIEKEFQSCQFKFEELEELQGDLDKINRWFAEAKQRDFWGNSIQIEVQKLIDEVEARLADFIQKTYDTMQNSQNGTDKL
jgi:hypothetical protein